MATIRRATKDDALAIHEAHMRSIQEVCSRDHSLEEIKAWGHRPFKEDQRIAAIMNQFVWVVEENQQIEGYGHLGLNQKDGRQLAHIYGLYLTPKIIGQGLGRRLATLMIGEARTQGAESVALESTLTARHFYQSVGFKETGPQMTVQVSGVGIRCFPMLMNLKTGE